MNRILYVTGTERGVGKTTVAAALITLLRRQQQRVAVMKPVSVGCSLRLNAEAPVQVGGMPGEQDRASLAALTTLTELAGAPPSGITGETPREALRAQDVEHLMAVAKRQDADPLVNPYRFAPDLEPAAAARAGGQTIDLGVLVAACEALQDSSDWVIMEGTGTLMDPLNDNHLALDLVDSLAAEVLLVAPSRPWGAIAPCLSAALLLQQRGLSLRGIVLNRQETTLNPEEAVNPMQLEQHQGDVVRGILPRLERDPRQAVDHLADRFRVHVDVDSLLAT